MSDFVIHLPSNVQPTRFPSNCASNYSTQLDNAIDLNGEWDVALVEVTYPKSVKMFEGEGIKFTETIRTPKCRSVGRGSRKHVNVGVHADTPCTETNDVDPAVLSKHTYWQVPSPRENTIEALVETLNEKSTEFGYSFQHRNGILSLTLHDQNKELQLDKSLADLLGFDRFHFNKEGVTHYGFQSPALYRNIDYVFIYSNILDHVNVGHMTAPLLHAIPFMKDGHGPLIHHAIRTPIFRPMNASKLDRIDLRLCDGNGQDIPFIEGKTLIILNIRRRIL